MTFVLFSVHLITYNTRPSFTITNISIHLLEWRQGFIQTPPPSIKSDTVGISISLVGAFQPKLFNSYFYQNVSRIKIIWYEPFYTYGGVLDNVVNTYGNMISVIPLLALCHESR